MERYRLSWTQSSDDFADGQSVWAKINGAVAVAIVPNLMMTVNQVEFDFPTGASVEWYVQTIDDTGTKSALSVSDTFTADNLATLTPATGLSHVWVAHVA